MFGEKENTEEKIIKATFDILQREGLAKTTTKKIAAEAGVNEVTIFRKFENKNNLLIATKDFYMKKFTDKLKVTFDFNEDDDMEEYLHRSFQGILDFTEDDVNIIKVALAEVKDTPERKLLIAQITEPVLDKLKAFFELQIEKGEIRDVDTNALALIYYSIMIESVVLLQIHGSNSDLREKYQNEAFVDILYHGIKA